MRQKKPQAKISIKNSINHGVSVKKQPFNSSQTIKFDKSDIVWAKITGYPWWPAIVTIVPGQKIVDKKYDDMKKNYPWSNFHHNVKAEYRVDFIADQTHAFLKKNFLLNYLPNRERLYVEGLQFSTRKRRYFQMAVNEADQLQQVLELSKNEQYKFKNDEPQQQSESFENKSDSQIDQNQEQSDSNDSESESISESQQKSEPEIRITRLKKTLKSSNKKDQQSVTISNQSCIHSRNNQNKKNTLRKNNKNFIKKQLQNQEIQQVKRGRPCKKLNSFTKIDNIRTQKQQKQAETKEQKLLFAKFTVSQECLQKASQNKLPNKQYNSEQNLAENRNQNLQRSAIFERQQTASLKMQTDSQFNKTQQLFSDLVKKYKLEKIEQIQALYKKKQESKQKEFSDIQNQNSLSLKVFNRKFFIKKTFPGLGKKKQSRKILQQKILTSQQDIFQQNLTILGKLKQNNQQTISFQQQRFLLELSKKYSAKKIYCIVMRILRKNNVENQDQQVLISIRQRCKNIANMMFQQDGNTFEQSQKKNNRSNRNKVKNSEKINFLSFFKKKIEQNINCIRLFSMQNWDLLFHMSSLSTELCRYIKSFQIYLQENFHLKMRNQQKFQDIAKQISLENQKTAFSILNNPNEMQIQHESLKITPNLINTQTLNQCLKIEKGIQEIFVQTK